MKKKKRPSIIFVSDLLNVQQLSPFQFWRNPVSGLRDVGTGLAVGSLQRKRLWASRWTVNWLPFSLLTQVPAACPPPTFFFWEKPGISCNAALSLEPWGELSTSENGVLLCLPPNFWEKKKKKPWEVWHAFAFDFSYHPVSKITQCELHLLEKEGSGFKEEYL